MRAKPLTPHQESEIVKMYKLKIRGESIAKFTGASVQQVYRVIYIKHKLRLKYRNWTLKDIREMKDKFIYENKSYSDLGREYDVCPTWLKTQMERSGWTKNELLKQRKSVS